MKRKEEEKKNPRTLYKINSLLLKRSTVSGSSTGLVLVGPAKVKTQKYILFTESTNTIYRKSPLFSLVTKNIF